MAKKKGLTAQQQAFVDEYIVSGNATQAYRIAFPGGTYRSAAVESSKLLRKPDVEAEIRAARRDLRQRSLVKADRVIREYAKLAFADINDIMDLTDPANPTLRARADIPADARRAIQEVSRTQWGVKVKLADKISALDKLSRHLGLYKDLPPLEAILAILPAGLREQVRQSLAASVLGGGSGETGGPATPGLHPGPGAGVPPGGDGTRPVADGVPGGPGEAAGDAVLPPGGEVGDLGGPDVGALFD